MGKQEGASPEPPHWPLTLTSGHSSRRTRERCEHVVPAWLVMLVAAAKLAETLPHPPLGLTQPCPLCSRLPPPSFDFPHSGPCSDPDCHLAFPTLMTPGCP